MISQNFMWSKKAGSENSNRSKLIQKLRKSVRNRGPRPGIQEIKSQNIGNMFRQILNGFQRQMRNLIVCKVETPNIITAKKKKIWSQYVSTS